MQIVVTGACAVSARNVLRSLKMSEKFKDATFVGWDMCSILYGAYSGDFERLYKVPAINDPQYRNVVKDILAKEKLDVALLDMQLPDMTGFDVADTYVEKMQGKVPLIALTANVINDPKEYERHHINGVMNKPLSLSKLVENLQKYQG